MQYMYPYDIPMFPVIPFLRLKKQKNTHFELQLFFFVPEISGDFWCLTPPLAGEIAAFHGWSRWSTYFLLRSPSQKLYKELCDWCTRS